MQLSKPIQHNSARRLLLYSLLPPHYQEWCRPALPPALPPMPPLPPSGPYTSSPPPPPPP